MDDYKKNIKGMSFKMLKKIITPLRQNLYKTAILDISTNRLLSINIFFLYMHNFNIYQQRSFEMEKRQLTEYV